MAEAPPTSTLRSRILGGLALFVVAFALFVIPSAYSHARGRGFWVSLIVGLAVFPILPAVWHVLSERKRRKAPPAKSQTTGWERWLFRTGVVGVVLVGALIAIDGGRVWRAVKTHAFWFVPDLAGNLEPRSALLDRVPENANGVLWLRDTDDVDKALALLKLDTSDSFEAVVAFTKQEATIIERGDIGLIELATSFQEMLVELGAPSHVVTGKIAKDADGIRTWRSNGSSTPGSTPSIFAPSTLLPKPRTANALVERMAIAPDDAFLVGAAHEDGKSAVGWLRVRDRIFQAAVLEAGAVLEAPASELAKLDEKIDELRDTPEFECWRDAGGILRWNHDGTTMRIDVSIEIDAIEQLAKCKR